MGWMDEEESQEMEDIEDMAKGAYTPRELRSTVSYSSRRRSSAKQASAVQFCEPVASVAVSSISVPGIQTIYLKTFGCSHNQSDSEYMAGQLSAYGYSVTDEANGADLWLINTCTVKNPSQSAMETLIRRGKEAKKPLVVAGCVPQGNSTLKDLDGVSIVGVQQIDRVVEVVEETLKGNEVRLLRRRTLPALDLPKIRRNKFVEIVPINVGCLGACTYCKTKHARGHLGSYTVSALVDRVRSVIADGVKEIWLSSEDTGAYGRDLGTDLPTLLRALTAELPEDRSTMLRIGMTNPPYILQHLDAVAEILRHPCVYSFLHVPIQSGSDAVLKAMKRDYSVAEFRQVVDTLLRLVPGIHIATDIICGFPGETVEDFEETLALIQEYKFPQVHISQFYPRPGTPAARMKRVPTSEVKNRSRQLTSIFDKFSPYKGLEDQIERVLVTDIATDGIHLVGHTKSYVQVLLPSSGARLGSSIDVKIISVGRWSVMGEPLSPLPSEKIDQSDQSLVTSVGGQEKRTETTTGLCCTDTDLRKCSCKGESKIDSSQNNKNCSPDLACCMGGCEESGESALSMSPTEATLDKYDESLTSVLDDPKSSAIGLDTPGKFSQLGRRELSSTRNRKRSRSERGRRIMINYGGEYPSLGEESISRREVVSLDRKISMKSRWSWVDWVLLSGMAVSIAGIILGVCGLLYPRIIS